MRRSFLARWMSTFGLFAVVVSIGAAVPAGGGASRLLYVATDDGVRVVDPASGETTLSAHDALPTGDWTLVVRARPAGKHATRVEATDPASGAVVQSEVLRGALSVRAVSRSGDLVALMPREHERYGGGALYRPDSRDHSRIVISRLGNAPAQVIDLPANIEPEAFSTDGTALFVIQYSPPLHPDRYRVRRLDLARAELQDVYTTDKELQGNMRGVARTQVLARDGSRLYTLYTKPNGEAFVHVLSLDQQFANCVDLPKGFGRTPSAMAITTSTDGRRIMVADGAARRVTEISNATLKVLRTATFGGLSAGDGRIIASAGPNSLFIGRGHTVVQLSAGTFDTVSRLSIDGSVQALDYASTGMLYVAGRDAITAIDPRSNTRHWKLDLGTRGIRAISDSLPPTGKGYVNCAC